MSDLTSPDIVMTVALGVGIAAGVTVATMLLRRAPQSIPGVSRSDRFGTAFTAGGAIFVGTTALGNAVSTTLVKIGASQITVTGVERIEPKPEDDILALTGIAEATSTAVDVTLTNAPPSVVGWLLAADLLPILLTLIICAAAVWLALGILNGAPFGQRFPVALVVTASAVMFCGLAANYSAAIARAETARLINLEDGPFMALSFAIDLAPLGWGLVIGLLAGAFQIGTCMQRDSKGLV